MNGNYIFGFDQLEKLLESKNLSDNAKKYSYLTWLGLTPSEMTSSYYNHRTRTVESDDRVIFVKEDRIAELLAPMDGQAPKKSEISSAETELNDAGISPAQLYKMSFFNIRLAQAELGQPEDIVRIKEMSRHIGQSAAELDKEYAAFCEMKK